MDELVPLEEDEAYRRFGAVLATSARGSLRGVCDARRDDERATTRPARTMVCIVTVVSLPRSRDYPGPGLL
jgi:hypothetical protein